MPEESKKRLSPVNESEKFKTKDGEEIESLESFYEKLKNMDEETFSHHVNEEKNDYSEWVKNSIGDETLALKLERTKDIEETMRIVEERIDELKRRVHMGEIIKKINYFNVQRAKEKEGATEDLSKSNNQDLASGESAEMNLAKEGRELGSNPGLEEGQDGGSFEDEQRKDTFAEEIEEAGEELKQEELEKPEELEEKPQQEEGKDELQKETGVENEIGANDQDFQPKEDSSEETGDNLYSTNKEEDNKGDEELKQEELEKPEELEEKPQQEEGKDELQKETGVENEIGANDQDFQPKEGSSEGTEDNQNATDKEEEQPFQTSESGENPYAQESGISEDKFTEVKETNLQQGFESQMQANKQDNQTEEPQISGENTSTTTGEIGNDRERNEPSIPPNPQGNTEEPEKKGFFKKLFSFGK